MNRRHFLERTLAIGALPIATSGSARLFRAEATASSETQPGGVTGPLAQPRANRESVALSTGLRDLDRLTNGLLVGSLTIVAGRPSLGKSLLVLHIAEQIAGVHQRAVAVACPRDGAANVAERLVCLRAGVWRERILAHRGALEMAPSAALAYVATIPVLLDDTSPTVSRLAKRAIRFALTRTVPLGAIIVDDVDRLVVETMLTEGEQSRKDSAAAELRSVARALNVPVIVTAKVSRAVEDRCDMDDYRPRITDFDEPYASALRAADLVIAIYRDEVYHEDSPDAGTAELILLRNRFGRLGTVKARLGGGRFSDW